MSNGVMEPENNKICNYCAICGKQSTAKCSNCALVYYCSVEHQKTHWKEHKHQCHPFQILTNEKFGRHLIASRDIKPGEIVLKESPLVKGPSQITSMVCVGCLQGIKEDDAHSECERCGWPICSQNCQDNPDHRYECELTVARGSKVSLKHYFTPHPTYQCLTTLRCLLLKEKDPQKWSKLTELESHCEQRRGSAQWRSDREGVAKFIPRFFKCNLWNETEILRVAGIVQINGHEVPLTDPAYVAIYNNASLIEHSCLPNLTKTFTSKGEVLFWTVNPIKKGEHLSICYSDALWGTSNRQHHLLQTKMFRCDCVRCMDVTELGTFYNAVKCNRKETKCKGMMLPESLEGWEENWKCNVCDNIVDFSYPTNVVDRAGKDLEAMDKANESHCLKYIEHYSQWLPEHHYYICEVKIALVQQLGTGDPEVLQNLPEKLLNMKIDIAKDILKLYTILAPVETRILGSLRFEAHAGLAELGRRQRQSQDADFRLALQESLSNAEETVRLLEKEPTTLSEGQICAQAKINAKTLTALLLSI